MHYRNVSVFSRSLPKLGATTFTSPRVSGSFLMATDVSQGMTVPKTTPPATLYCNSGGDGGGGDNVFCAVLLPTKRNGSAAKR